MSRLVSPDSGPISAPKRTTKTKKTKADPISTYTGTGTRPKTIVPKTVSNPKTSSNKKTTKAESDPYAAERKRVQKREKELDKKARDEQNRQARTTAQNDLIQSNNQILAKRAQREVNKDSLSSLARLVNGGLEGVLKNGIASVNASLKTKMDQINKTYSTSLDSFKANQRDNTSSEGDDSFMNVLNRARETGDLTTMATEQGAGESDLLKTQLQAVRNWSANQNEINRSFFDTESSINSGITDLNNTTKTSKINEEMSANATTASLYDDYFSTLSDTYSQMANLDQQNFLLTGEITSVKDSQKQSRDLLKHLDRGKSWESYKAPKINTKLQPVSKTQYKGKYDDKAAEVASRTWKDPGVSEATKNWQGERLRSVGLTNSIARGNAPDAPKRKRPEGSTLKSW